MAATEEPVNLRPVFCHRDDCDARCDRAFCAACGADIRAYVTSDLPSIAEQLRAAEHHGIPVLVTQAPPVQPAGYDGGGGNGAAPGPPDDDPIPPAPRRRAWRHPLVLGAFGASLALGAGAGVVAGLV